MKLDAFDIKILQQLQKDASQSVQVVADLVGLSHTPCWRRIKKLQDNGIISANVALVDAKKVGLGVVVFVTVKLNSHDEQLLMQFESAAVAMDEVMQCYIMSGDVDYLLRVVVQSIEQYEQTLKRKLVNLPGVSGLNSSFALRELKNQHLLPWQLVST
ncbi:MAG: Lrp/AsnC family transcriptional regulator [Oceanospirillaceae bacterium]|jgi:Lrp/AsnC family transcriptional regulator|nr:Lrp/AsnC family transcriptional regulator [Oceanospirillaceae bacterium]MBT4441915.1 Lrp/AsnC family transcriptional regulator [Oceanospirillaceae bacterium]MBT6076488.1 Lrp/AsnC family transcriptional regulator [Oceanospirillaceae bacterium]MBT7331067.1 Lrp/AsnC family transcriptional regulator [Oceanospirillaceae bacterium]